MFEKVAFTFYAVTDLPRARAFYEGTLGLKVGPVYGDDTKAWVEYDLPRGGCLAISNMTPQVPGLGGGTIAFEVSDREALVTRLQAAGVPFTSLHIPSPVCDMSIVTDPDGNDLILHQLKMKAGKTGKKKQAKTEKKAKKKETKGAKKAEKKAEKKGAKKAKNAEKKQAKAEKKHTKAETKGGKKKK